MLFFISLKKKTPLCARNLQQFALPVAAAKCSGVHASRLKTPRSAENADSTWITCTPNRKKTKPPLSTVQLLYISYNDHIDQFIESNSNRY